MKLPHGFVDPQYRDGRSVFTVVVSLSPIVNAVATHHINVI